MQRTKYPEHRLFCEREPSQFVIQSDQATRLRRQIVKTDMESKKLAMTALRVLSTWSKGDTPAPEDVKILRAHALAHEVDLPTDALACRIVARACLKE
jgi:hypothetical protein